MRANVANPKDSTGWVVAESRLKSRGYRLSSTLEIRRHSRPSSPEIIHLSVHPDGRVNELIRLPEDVAELTWQLPGNGKKTDATLLIRPAGWLERAYRIAIRITWAMVQLRSNQRSASGLTIWRIFTDLPHAYRAATELQIRYPLVAYADWIERFDTLRDHDVAAIRAHIRRFPKQPHFHLLVATEEGLQGAVHATLKSLRRQLYKNFTCTVLDSTDELNASSLETRDVGQVTHLVEQGAMSEWLTEFSRSVADRTDTWVMLLHAGDILPVHSLYRFAAEIQEKPDTAIFYSDDDIIDAAGNRADPRFKPEWSPTHFYSTHYLGAAAIFGARYVAEAGGISPDCCRHGNYDLLLRVIATGGKVGHLPGVLFHRGDIGYAGSAWEDPLWCASVLQRHLSRKRVAAEITSTLPACRRVRYRLPEAPPLVSIIVPTRDSMELLRNCLDSLRKTTTYPRFEILVIDNRTTQPDALAYLEQIAKYPGLRILRYDHAFNFSIINNIAAREAQGEILCLLNNDTTVISPDWLEEMVGHLLQDRVGVVGAKLYYPDSRVQHAGVAVGPGGCADHVSLGIGRDEPGYCFRAVVAHELSAVTGACMATWKHLYEQLGGLNENLTVGFNDVDYCLRVQEAGYRVIFTPHAELFHHESATRGRDDHLLNWRRNSREVKYIRSRWSDRIRHDPYYNINLSYRRPDFSLSEAPRVRKPWL